MTNVPVYCRHISATEQRNLIFLILAHKVLQFGYKCPTISFGLTKYVFERHNRVLARVCGFSRDSLALSSVPEVIDCSTSASHTHCTFLQHKKGNKANYYYKIDMHSANLTYFYHLVQTMPSRKSNIGEHECTYSGIELESSESISSPSL